MKTKQETLVGVGELEKLALRYEAGAKMLRKIAKGLRGVTEGLGRPQQAQPLPKPQRRPKGRLQAKGKASIAQPQKRKMSPAARRKLSQAMKLRWLERKAQAAVKDAQAGHGPNGKKKAPEGEAA